MIQSKLRIGEEYTIVSVHGQNEAGAHWLAVFLRPHRRGPILSGSGEGRPQQLAQLFGVLLGATAQPAEANPYGQCGQPDGEVDLSRSGRRGTAGSSSGGQRRDVCLAAERSGS